METTPLKRTNLEKAFKTDNLGNHNTITEGPRHYGTPMETVPLQGRTVQETTPLNKGSPGNHTIEEGESLKSRHDIRAAEKTCH